MSPYGVATAATQPRNDGSNHGSRNNDDAFDRY